MINHNLPGFGKTLTKKNIETLDNLSIKGKGYILKATTVAQSGHPGGSMSSLDMYLTVFGNSNVFNRSKNENRDRFIISHGHTAPGWYATLALFDVFPETAFLSGFRSANSPFAGHVEHIIPYVDWDTGNLGQGLSAACGKAFYLKHKGYDSHVWCFMGDGEQQKGQISEARRFIVKYKLTNCTVLIDFNKLQISGTIHSVMPQNIKAEWEASGFKVLEINGHNHNEIYNACNTALQNSTTPYCILAHTTMGKGVSFMENKEKYHGSALDKELCAKALEELYIENNLDELVKARKTYDFSTIIKLFDSYKINHLTHEICPKVASSPKSVYPIDAKTDCRSAYGKELLAIANEMNEQLFVFDCDLAESVKTNDFARQFPSYFIQSGIMEHHTAATAGSLSKEACLVFFSDFAMFGLDETYNQQRLNDINECNLKTVLTHAGANVGEDGKTHQCIDYLSLARSLFSYTVLLPADPNQTLHIIRYISKNRGNFLVVMGRSKTPIITKDDAPFFDKSYKYSPDNIDIIDEGSTFIISYGPVFGEAYEAYKSLKSEKHDVGLINISSPLTVNKNLVNILKGKKVLAVEDHNIHSGLYFQIIQLLYTHNVIIPIKALGIKEYSSSGDHMSVYSQIGIDRYSIIEQFKKM